MDSTQEKISKALGLDELSTEEQDKILEEFNALVFKSSLISVMERMDEKTRSDFAELTAKEPSDEVVTEFLMQRVPDLDKAVEESIAAITDDILTVSQS